MRLNLGSALIGLVAMLTGCATPDTYEGGMFGKPYRDSKLADGLYTVTVDVNAATPAETASEFWKRRATELCGTSEFEANNNGTMRGVVLQRPIVQGTVRCPGATAQAATIRDLVISEGPSKGLFYYVEKIDDKVVENSLGATIEANHGRGLVMVPQRIERPVLADTDLRLSLAARVEFAAPILAIFHWSQNHKALAVVRFRAKPKGSYVVRGILSEARSDVWLEDEDTGERVGIVDPPGDANSAK